MGDNPDSGNPNDVNLQPDPADLVDIYGPLIMAICLAHTKNSHDAEDIAQDVLLKAIRHLHTLKDPDRIRPWLAQITRRACVDFYRIKKKHKAMPLSKISGEKTAQTGEKTDETGKKLEEMHRFIAKLPPRYRDIITLFYLNEQNCPQIAQILNIKEAAVRRRLTRARRILHNLMSENEL